MKNGKQKKKKSRPPDWLFGSHPADRKHFFLLEDGLKYKSAIQVVVLPPLLVAGPVWRSLRMSAVGQWQAVGMSSVRENGYIKI